MDNLGNTPTQRQEDTIVSTTLTVQDNGEIQLGETSGGADDVTYPCVTMLFTAGGTISQFDLLKMVDDGSGNPVVARMLNGDDTRTGVVGTANKAATIGQDVEVCVGGSFKVFADAAAIAIGDILRRSSTVDGRVQDTSSSVGAFGISMTDTSGNELVTGVFLKNESA